jgi:hypothetical protein
MNTPASQEVTRTREELAPSIIIHEGKKTFAFTGRRGWWKLDPERNLWVKLQGDPFQRENRESS